MTLKLEVSATLNGGSIDLTVLEDTDGDGAPENVQTKSVPDGTNTISFGNINGSTGNRVKFRREAYGGTTVNPTMESATRVTGTAVNGDAPSTSSASASVTGSATVSGASPSTASADGSVTGHATVSGNSPATASAAGSIKNAVVDSASASANSDNTITVTWSVTDFGDDFDSFDIEEKQDTGAWNTLTTGLSGGTREYTTTAKADAHDAYKYRVKGIEGGSTADTATSDYAFIKETAVSGWDSSDSRVPAKPGDSSVTDGDGGSGSIDLPKAIGVGWDSSQTRNVSGPPPEAIAGEGTALRAIADELQNAIEDGASESLTGDDKYEFGIPITDKTGLTADTSVEWPVTIRQTYALEITDPDLIKSIDLNSSISGDCTVDTQISDYKTIDGAIVFTIEHTVSCPTATSENITTEITPVGTSEATSSDAGSAYARTEASPTTGTTTTTYSDDTTADPGGDDYTYSDPYETYRRVSCGGACIPQDGAGSFSVSAFIENRKVDAFDLRIDYDPSIVEVTGATSSAFSVTVQKNDTTDGYLRVTGSAGSDLDYTYSAKNNSLLSVDVNATGANGDTATLDVLSSSSVSLNGDTIGNVNFTDGVATIGAGYEIPDKGVGFGDTVSVPVSVDSGVDVAEYDVTFSYPSKVVDVTDVTGGDLAVTNYVVNGDGTVTVEGSGVAASDPTLFNVTFEAYLPDTPKQVKEADTDKVTVDGALSTLKDANGNTISAPCSHSGKLTISTNVSDYTFKDNNVEIPEVGVVYWPITLPLTFRIEDMDTANITEDMVQVKLTSATNPDIGFAETNTEIGPPRAPSSVIVSGVAVIPKANPQNYPVDLNGFIWIGRAQAGVGSGLLIGAPVSFGHMGSGISTNTNIPALGRRSRQGRGFDI